MKALFLSLSVSLATFSCGGSSSVEEPSFEITKSEITRATPIVAPANLSKAVEGNNEFTLELYKKAVAVDADKNLSLSPLSVSLALAMTYAGANGVTAIEMKDALHFDLPPAQLHPALNALDLALESRGKNAKGADGKPFRLKIANSVWGQSGHSFEQPYLDTIALNYGAGLNLLDFESDSEGSRKTINQWVEQKTENRIQDLIPEGSITAATKFVLTNAIYFNAAWTTPFEKENTGELDFNNIDMSTSKTMFMQSYGEEFNYAKLDGFEALEMKYEGDEVSMILISPDDLTQFEAKLDLQLLESIDNAFMKKSINVKLPKFENKSSHSIGELMRELGMKTAFLPSADFAGISKMGGLYISEIIQKTFVKIDEKGTEAAAATAVILKNASAPPETQILQFDQPFLYLIRDIETKSILFIGRVTHF